MLRTITRSLQSRVQGTVSATCTLATKANAPVITCKRPEFNLHLQELPAVSDLIKPDNIKLASEKWRHKKSPGDFFILHPIQTSVQAHTLSERTFRDLGIRKPLVDNIKASGVECPTEFQAEAIPVVLNGGHALVAAETGCGKTYTYLLPIVEQILRRKLQKRQRNFNSPLLLIVTPGRELAQQIGQVAASLTEGQGINTRVILGGRTKQQMMNPEFEEIDILIASFGALSKLTTGGVYRMDEVRFVVLDEADTLLDDSFNPQLLHLMKRFAFHQNMLQDLRCAVHGTQLVLAAATMPTNMDDLLAQIVNVETVEHIVSPNMHRILSHVTQRFLRVRKMDRPQILLDLIKKDSKRQSPTIVFSNKTPACDFVSIHLNENGFSCVNLNGDMLLKLRLGQFEKFQQAEVNVLSTTDVASRGLDTTRAAHIINFDFPFHAADYLHRVGRIGRIGSRNDCLVTNLVSSQAEIDAVQRIERAARTSSALGDVDANVTGIVRRNIAKSIQRMQTKVG